jgi:hypothetical protein
MWKCENVKMCKCFVHRSLSVGGREEIFFASSLRLLRELRG